MVTKHLRCWSSFSLLLLTCFTAGGVWGRKAKVVCQTGIIFHGVHLVMPTRPMNFQESYWHPSLGVLTFPDHICSLGTRGWSRAEGQKGWLPLFIFVHLCCALCLYILHHQITNHTNRTIANSSAHAFRIVSGKTLLTISINYSHCRNPRSGPDASS